MNVKEITVCNKVRECEQSVAERQLELDFLKDFRKKVETGSVKLVGTVYAPSTLDSLIMNLEDCCSYETERLNFYKNIQESLGKEIYEEFKKATEYPSGIILKSAKYVDSEEQK